MRLVENLGRIAQRVARGAVGMAAMALALVAGGCGSDDKPVDNQCKAKFEVSSPTCDQMTEFLACAKESFSPPNNCNLSRCDCPFSIACDYSFEVPSEADCGGIWFTLNCDTQFFTPGDIGEPGTCDLGKCLCFGIPPTPRPTSTPRATATPTP